MPRRTHSRTLILTGGMKIMEKGMKNGQQEQPGIVIGGGSVDLKPVRQIAQAFGFSYAGAVLMLKSLRVPLLYLPHGTFFNSVVLEEALFLMSDLGGKGYAAPGTRAKKNMYDPKKKMDLEVKLPDEMATPARRTKAQQRIGKITQTRLLQNKDFVRKKLAKSVRQPRGN